MAPLLGAAFPKPRYYLVVRDSSAEARSLLEAVRFDVVLLHWDTQEPRSLEILPQIRNNARTPVCIVVGDGARTEREMAIALGADEVVAAYGRPEQLRFCLQLLLQRTGVAPPGSCLFGRLSINPTTFSVRWRDLEIRLGPVEFRLLELMLRHHREILSREFILSQLWPSGGYKSRRLVDVHVSSLRRAFFRDAQLRPFQTVPGVGYRLRINCSRDALVEG